MTLRHRGLEPLLVSTPCLVIAPQSVPVVRFELARSTVSYLTSELRQWEFAVLDDQDRLRIRAGTDWVTVTGQSLHHVRSALDQMRLQLLRESPARPPHDKNTWVRSIEIEAPKLSLR